MDSDIMNEVKKSKIFKWLDNFWYHYKWPAIIVLFFGLFFAVAIGQMVSKPKTDIYVMYTGPTAFLQSEISGIETAFEQIMSEDFDGSGEKRAVLTDISLMTEDQAIAAKEAAISEGDKMFIDVRGMQAAENKYNLELTAGDCYICLLDPYWYKEARDAGRFVKLSEVLGSKPDIAADEYGILFADTEFAQFFTVMKAIPEDTMLALRRFPNASFLSNADKSKYEYHEHMLRDIVSFRFPEDFTPDGVPTNSVYESFPVN
ncbi:MAG: hypothetical protein GX628_05340 [Clostridiales bacterium]|nr:hypothetical protein [Clostridiales bacterium]